jgi:site-specific DNA-methyltransferase (adenine-specific)
MTTHRVVIGDSRWMSEVADKSVHLILTSPPYWQLKDYGNSDQIGFDDTYEDYINNLNLVWNECYRALENNCRLCINIGDQFARSVYYGRYKIIPIRTEIIKFCETIGFDYMGAIIWQKVTTCNTTGGATIMGSFPYPRNGIIKIDYEFILIFKKPGIGKNVPKSIKDKSKLTIEEWNQYFAGHWNIPGEKQNGHLAMFPEEIPRRLIKMFSFVNDTVLDPFLGSGTTTLAAKNLERNSIGYEISANFIPVIKEKLGLKEKGFFDKISFELAQNREDEIDWKEEIRKLPYIFKDPVRFDKKIDPRKLQFGSKINGDSQKRQDYHCVKKVISPTELELDDGLKIRLLGIKEKTEKKQQAIEFLQSKTKGQKVFMKFGQVKHDSKNNLLCYLYLQNKTFINAHLVKEGLASTDTETEFKYKNKFADTAETGAYQR